MKENTEPDLIIRDLEGFLPEADPTSKTILASTLRVLLGKKSVAYANDIINDKVPGESNVDSLRRIFNRSGLILSVPDEDLIKIPETGKVLIAGNHPNGITELRIIKMIARRRTDINGILMDLLANILDITDQSGIRASTIVQNGHGLSGQGDIRNKVIEALN